MRVDFAVENVAAFCQYKFLFGCPSYCGKHCHRKALGCCFLEGGTCTVDKVMLLLNNAVRKG